VHRLLTTDQDRSEERLVALATHDLDQEAVRKIIDHRPKDWTSASSRSDLRMEVQCVSPDGPDLSGPRHSSSLRSTSEVEKVLKPQSLIHHSTLLQHLFLRNQVFTTPRKRL